MTFTKFASVFAIVSMCAIPAHAGGWGKSSGSQQVSSGLLNVSPSVQLGNVGLLNGLNILGGSSILSGNTLSGIVKGNGNNVGTANTNGHQNAVGNGFVGGGSFANTRASSFNSFKGCGC